MKMSNWKYLLVLGTALILIVFGILIGASISEESDVSNHEIMEKVRGLDSENEQLKNENKLLRDETEQMKDVLSEFAKYNETLLSILEKKT